jgi:MFS family permease
VGSAIGISLFLLVYYAASAFFTIYWSTVFKQPNGLNLTTGQANGLNAWFWWADAAALIIFGVLSDKFRVRKPFMLIGAIGSIVMLIVFLQQANNAHTSHNQLVLIEVILAACISLCYAPWMAAYTEMVEAKNPALVGTGLALWGWILRLTVGLSFLFLPLVVNSVNPVVDNLPYATPQVQQFLVQHPDSVAFAQEHATFLAVLNTPTNKPIVAALAANPSLSNIVAATKALGPANFALVVKYQTQLTKLVVPYETQLNYLAAHQSQLQALQNGVAKSPKQWQHWFWVCVGGMILFIPTIFLNHGRWSPAKAREDEEQHEADVAEELRELEGANA